MFLMIPYMMVSWNFTVRQDIPSLIRRTHETSRVQKQTNGQWKKSWITAKVRCVIKLLGEKHTRFVILNLIYSQNQMVQKKMLFFIYVKNEIINTNSKIVTKKFHFNLHVINIISWWEIRTLTRGFLLFRADV